MKGTDKPNWRREYEAVLAARARGDMGLNDKIEIAYRNGLIRDDRKRSCWFHSWVVMGSDQDGEGCLQCVERCCKCGKFRTSYVNSMAGK